MKWNNIYIYRKDPICMLFSSNDFMNNRKRLSIRRRLKRNHHKKTDNDILTDLNWNEINTENAKRGFMTKGGLGYRTDGL